MTSPTVSIVLPTFNRLKYLRPAVASVFAQTFTDWELIVADDGSEAETADYLASISDPPRVTVLRLPHSGDPGALRNAAWQAARGEYIAFLDSDDVWMPEKLAVQVASLDRHRTCAWSHTAFAAIDESGQLLAGRARRWWPAAQGWILTSVIKMETVIAISSVIVRRPLLEQAGGFDVGLPACNDYDFWLRAAGLSEIDGVRETLLHKRTHQESYYGPIMVLEERRRAIEKVLAVSRDASVRSMLRKERAKIAAQMAHSQAVHVGRWAALRTLVKSSQYSWGYPEWWMGGAHAAARAMAPNGILRLARAVVHRKRGARQ
jgi:glycosyltransferase involved in cell wall biosynthesis